MVKVSVIIPCYNKSSTIGRTIDSVLAQTLRDIEVIVINDGSTDNSEEVILNKIGHLDYCKYIYQDNAGVAIARNAGVSASSGRYIMCLDSDDAIEIKYLEHLSNALDENPSISIVYTSLFYITPDGKSGLSKWPADFDANKQVIGQNQIPTSAMMRRKVWESLGGQRQRYAPLGAGAEDGEFWLRATAYGFDSKYINPVPDSLFIYSWLSGMVSGNKDYSEVDYKSWHPWTKDKRYPIPCLAKPEVFSHPARWYDEPHISVIIPVGPNHSKYLVDCLDSLDAQTERYWEAIVIFDVGKDEWSSLIEDKTLEYIEKTWPWCRFTTTSVGKDVRTITSKLTADKAGRSLLSYLNCDDGPYGPGKARNIGVKLARSPLVLFLDADDWLVPEALERMKLEYIRTKTGVYSDHYAIAQVKEADLNLVDGQVVSYNPKQQAALIMQRAAEFDCEKAMRQPDKKSLPYIWCSVTTLMPKNWLKTGFDETLKSWEDVLFFWKLAWEGKCFTRIPEPLFVYRYTTGARRDTGLTNAQELLAIAGELSRGTEKMGCNCKGDKKPVSLRVTGNTINSVGGNVTVVKLNLSRGGTIEVSDSDLELCLFSPASPGDKLRSGKNDFGGSNFISYGYRGGGETFLVHRLDIEAEEKLASNQGRLPEFQRISQAKIVVNDDKNVTPPPMVQAPPSPVVQKPAVVQEQPKLNKRSISIRELNMGEVKLKNRIMVILEQAEIYTIGDLVDYEASKPNGLTEIKGIGQKIRDGLMAQAREFLN